MMETIKSTNALQISRIESCGLMEFEAEVLKCPRIIILLSEVKQKLKGTSAII